MNKRRRSYLLQGARRNRNAFHIALALCSICIAAYGNAQSDWLKTRQADFASWQFAHPDPEGELSDLKAKTAILVAQAPRVIDLLAPPVSLRVQNAIVDLWDSPIAPQMVIVPAGNFTMGSPGSEIGRAANEGTQRRVTINNPFAVGKFPVTRDEYAAFIAETKRPDGGSCYTTDGTLLMSVPGLSWHDPGFPQGGRDPVVCVSWDDAHAYIAWLSRKTGKRYRLLSEAEWEYAARAGTTTAHYWGDAANHDYANYGTDIVGAIATGISTGSTASGAVAGRDQWMTTSPVDSFPPNAFGLYDMAGNVLSWTQDCFVSNYAAPSDGTPLNCNTRALRGGNWLYGAASTRSAARVSGATLSGTLGGTAPASTRSSFAGFRVARIL